MELQSIIGDYPSFIHRLLTNIQKIPIDISGFSCDHIGYRVATKKEYRFLQNRLYPTSQSWTENMHNGRPISIYKLKNPLSVSSLLIPLIELPSPRKDKPYATGLEHIEIVVSDYVRFKKTYANVFSDIHNKGQFNETLIVSFFDMTTVKFHAHSLETVVTFEGSTWKDIS